MHALELLAKRTLAFADLRHERTTLAERASPELPEHLRERLPSAQAHAAQQLEQVRPKLDAVKRQIEHDLTAALSSRRNFEARYDAFLAAAEQVTRLVGPKSACRRGCTHCCHIPVAVTEVEAEVIAKRIGVKARHEAPILPPGERGYGYDKPCPFLANGSCSIYANRPVTCRLHFNMDRDDLLCRLLPETTVPLPLANMRTLQETYMRLCDGSPLADIRDHFPRGKHR